MRALALLPLLFVASCGGGAAENKAAAVVAAPSPGQWELTSQVTRFRKADQGTSSIDTPIGTRATQSLCVAAGGQLPTEEVFKAPVFEDSVSGKPNPVQCRKDLPGAIYLSSELPDDDQAKAVGQ